jgi:hypothetical protein
LGLNSPPVQAQNPHAKTLKGISAVWVLVENLPDGAKKLNPSESTIQTDVELKMRLAGIRVVTVAEEYQVPGGTYLYVNLGLTDGAEAGAIRLELHQDATLERNGQFAAGIETSEARSVIANPTAQSIRDQIKDLCDKFSNDWLSANPKK